MILQTNGRHRNQVLPLPAFRENRRKPESPDSPPAVPFLCCPRAPDGGQPFGQNPFPTPSTSSFPEVVPPFRPKHDTVFTRFTFRPGSSILTAEYPLPTLLTRPRFRPSKSPLIHQTGRFL